MTIDEYLTREFTGWPENGDPGVDSGWLEFCQLTVREGKVHIVDASYAADSSAGCFVELTPGVYQAEARIMSYGRHKHVARLRVIQAGIETTVGAKIGETGVDTGAVGVYDYEPFERAWGADNEVSYAIISPTLESLDTHGVAVLDEAAGAVMPVVSSGFGDDEYPVFELISNGVRVGLDVVFIYPDEGYPFHW